METSRINAVLCSKRLPVQLKGKLYRTVVRSVFLNGSGCWTVKESRTQDRPSGCENAHPLVYELVWGGGSPERRGG